MNGAGRIALLLIASGELAFMFPVARTASATASDALAQCAAISAPDARLACYDTLAGRNADRSVSSATGPPPAANPVPAASAVSAPAAPTAPVVAPAPVAAPVVAATSASAAGSAPVPNSPAQDPKNFGYSAAQQQSPAQKAQVLESIQAHVAQVPADQLRATYVVLDNGQAWACTDGDMNLSVGEAVTIKRAAMGSFVLTAASKHSYHVRRLR